MKIGIQGFSSMTNSMVNSIKLKNVSKCVKMAPGFKMAAKIQGMNIKIFKKLLRAEFLPDFQNVCTKIFQKDSSFQKKIFKKFMVRLSGKKKTKNYKF